MIFLLVPWLLVGCGVAQEQYNSVVEQLNQIQQELQTVQSELNTVQVKNTELESSYEKAKSDLVAAQTELETAQGKVSELNSNLAKAEAELETVQAKLLEAKAEYGAFKLDLNDTWDSLVPKLAVLMSITDYWNNAAWVAVGEMSQEEYARAVGSFMANTGTYVDAVGNSELKQYWEDFFSYAAQENELETMASLAMLTDLLLYELIGEDIEAIGATLSGEFTSKGEIEAAETEFSNVQTAVIALMVDNQLVKLPNPVTVATNDMGAFPDTSVCGVNKIQDPYGNMYVRGQDKDGYYLYHHDISADGRSSPTVDYVTTQYTMGTYIVDSYGTVTQVTTGFE